MSSWKQSSSNNGGSNNTNNLDRSRSQEEGEIGEEEGEIVPSRGVPNSNNNSSFRRGPPPLYSSSSSSQNESRGFRRSSTWSRQQSSSSLQSQQQQQQQQQQSLSASSSNQQSSSRWNSSNSSKPSNFQRPSDPYSSSSSQGNSNGGSSRPNDPRMMGNNNAPDSCRSNPGSSGVTPPPSTSSSSERPADPRNSDIPPPPPRSPNFSGPPSRNSSGSYRPARQSSFVRSMSAGNPSSGNNNNNSSNNGGTARGFRQTSMQRSSSGHVSSSSSSFQPRDSQQQPSSSSQQDFSNTSNSFESRRFSSSSDRDFGDRPKKIDRHNRMNDGDVFRSRNDDFRSSSSRDDYSSRGLSNERQRSDEFQSNKSSVPHTSNDRQRSDHSSHHHHNTHHHHHHHHPHHRMSGTSEMDRLLPPPPPPPPPRPSQQSGEFQRQQSQSTSSDYQRPRSGGDPDFRSFRSSQGGPRRILSSYNAERNNDNNTGNFRQSPPQRRRTFSPFASPSPSQQRLSRQASDRSMDSIPRLPLDDHTRSEAGSEVRTIEPRTDSETKRPLDPRNKPDSRGYKDGNSNSGAPGNFPRSPSLARRWDPRLPRPDTQESSRPLPPNRPLSSGGDAVVVNKGLEEGPKALTVSVLGDPQAISRAETVVQQLSEWVSDPILQSEIKGKLKLPPKQVITKAMATIEAKIKKARVDMGGCNKALEEIKKEEEATELRRQQQAAEEEKRRIEKLKKEAEERIESRKKEAAKELKELEEKMNQELEEKDATMEDEMKAMEVQHTEHAKKTRNEEKKMRKQAIKDELGRASQSFDAELSKAEQLVNRTEMEISDAEANESSLKTEYQQNVGSRSTSEMKLGETSNLDIVAAIIAENRKKAKRAHQESLALLPVMEPDVDSVCDPKYGRTHEEWTNMARNVTGLSTALYSEPSESPYFEHNNKTHAAIALLVKEYIRDKQKRLEREGIELAEEYVVRRQIFEKKMRKKKGSVRESLGASSKRQGRASILGINNQGGNILSSDVELTPGGRSSSNPYRRLRRGGLGSAATGDFVRSEHEQEQIIAELTAKEAMEKRIAHGGCRVPRQVSALERGMVAQYVNTFNSHRVQDPVKESFEQNVSNTWSDMEKCIFLDRFLQHPKDFRKIASFLRNKSTKDCISFYYISKQSVPYKAALKEHLMRRKRRGDYDVWDATIQAAIAMGAVITAGTSEEKPLVFSLPPHDNSYHTACLHPMKPELFEPIDVSASTFDEEAYEEALAMRGQKRKRDPLFALEKSAQKYLRVATQEALGGSKDESSTGSDVVEGYKKSASAKAFGSGMGAKWTAAEKQLFFEAFEKYGKNWPLLCGAIRTRSTSQIKAFYNENKAQIVKQREETPAEIGLEIPRKKAAPSLTQSTILDSLHEEQNRIEAQRQREAQATAEAQHRQAVLELEARRVAQEQSEQERALRSGKLTEQEAWNQIQQQHQQQQLYRHHQQQQQQRQQQSAREEAQRVLRSQLGLSNLSNIMPSPWSHITQAQVAALQQQQQQKEAQHRAQQEQEAQKQLVQQQNKSAAAIRNWAARDPHALQNVLAFAQQHRNLQQLDSSQLHALASLSGLGQNAALLVENQKAEAAARNMAAFAGNNHAAEALNAIARAAALSPSPSSVQIAGALGSLGLLGAEFDPHAKQQQQR